MTQLQKRRVKKQATWLVPPHEHDSGWWAYEQGGGWAVEEAGCSSATAATAATELRRSGAGSVLERAGNASKERCTPSSSFPSPAVSSCVPTPTTVGTLPSTSHSPATPPLGVREQGRAGELACDSRPLTIGMRVELRDDSSSGKGVEGKSEGERGSEGRGARACRVGVITERLPGGRFRVSFRGGRADMRLRLPSPDVRLL